MTRLRVFSMGRAGDDLDDLDVDLPVEWAQPCDDLTIVFYQTETFGWHLHVHAEGSRHLPSFPWHDEVDSMLRAPRRPHHPRLPETADAWDDLEQGWWVSVVPVCDRVYLAETDLDAILGTADTTPVLRRPGLVTWGGVDIAWNSVSAAVWTTAWSYARRCCEAGAPAPTVEQTGCDMLA